MIVRVIDKNFEGGNPREGFINYEFISFSKCFVSWPNQKLEFPPVPVIFKKYIASSGIVLTSFYYQE